MPAGTTVDANGRPKPSATLYPQGLQKVIDHVHANGQKFGLYMIPGVSPDVYNASLPIAGAPGCTTHDIAEQPLRPSDHWHVGYKIDFSNPCSQKYIDSVVDLFAQWGVNFVKFDSVTPGSGISDLSLDARDDVAAWSAALKAHKIWFELSWALDSNYADYWRSKANGWRVDWDVECYCANDALTAWDNIARLLPDVALWWRNRGNGGWNDLDSLNVGNGSTRPFSRLAPAVDRRSARQAVQARDTRLGLVVAAAHHRSSADPQTARRGRARLFVASGCRSWVVGRGSWERSTMPSVGRATT